MAAVSQTVLVERSFYEKYLQEPWCWRAMEYISNEKSPF